MVILHFPRERFAFDCVPAFSYSSFSWRINGKGCHCPVNSFFLFFLFKNAQIKVPWQWCVCVFVLCLCAHSCVCLRGDKIALLFGHCWQKYPVLDKISMLADTTRLSLNMRYWPVSLPLWPQLESFMIIIIIIKMISYSANDSSVAWFYSAAWGVSVSKNMLSKLAHPDIKSC